MANLISNEKDGGFTVFFVYFSLVKTYFF